MAKSNTLPNPKESDEHEHEIRLRELRERLYSRTKPPEVPVRNELKDETHLVNHEWNLESVEPRIPPSIPAAQNSSFDMKTLKRPYRTKIIVGGMLFFCAALVLAGGFLLFGKNEISGKNISIEVSGPTVIGGGEELPLQVTIANNNAVTIESATLIIEYPYGTQSSSEAGKELTRERKPLLPLKQGEVINVPLNARVFGEENEEKSILISIEYRIEGSNATFFKEIDSPYRFTITSSPVVLEVEKVTQSSSGQDVAFNIIITSNSPSEISQLLVKAQYPQGFDFTNSTPNPLSGQDTWAIANLKPGAKQTIALKGVLVGQQDEAKVFSFSVGAPNESDTRTLASVFSVKKEEIKIENPFLQLGVEINGSKDEEVSVRPGATAQVSIGFKNTLSTTLYDGTIKVTLSGASLDKSQVDAVNGFYDSSSNTITWKSSDEKSLASLQPGVSSSVNFSVFPGGGTKTPQITFRVDVEGRRVSEGNVSEQLTGSLSRTIKVESNAAITASSLYSIGAFSNTGPIPPKAEETTTYTMRLRVNNGTNTLTDGVVTAKLPQYVTWLNQTDPNSGFAYNPQSREVTWKVGNVAGGASSEGSFQVSIKPSVSQVDQALTLLETQYFKATDKFTGTVIRSDSPALTTYLNDDPNVDADDARVVE